MKEHSCKEMKIFLSESRDPIKYDPVFREYYIEIKGSFNIITMSYCPWCGTKLPKELRNEFFDILDEYGIETDIGEYIKDKRIPAEFRTDEWWKKRGL
ncbi:DUF6980 family protein [Rickettsia endosymbiont of Orchestes rusci]|uniref:DUF6980 family protein n=1 Tax=Rickettsia endosymbiont of Orchestes rusci TaxID=3066250 RepID=UPI00313ADA72